ncbi:MAG TPA: hypothetical protein VFB39_00125 [Solirubrobacteraceae bacterium]|nr:hypothetical protein [Solirubrobacteraceae bacterium]
MKPDALPLPALLSAAFVAFVIEADNVAEQQLPHRTTSFGHSGQRGAVWLTSLAMWFNCVRGLSDGGQQTVAELEQRLRMETNLDGMRRWGYRGTRARDATRRRIERTVGAWEQTYGRTAVAELHGALLTMAGDGTRDGSPLFAGLEPPANGWRAQLSPPRLLPWHPLILHRGGYPDGS